MKRIGILGAGHLGKIHIRILLEIAGWELVGFFDPDETNAAQVIEKFGLHRFSSVEELLAAVDAVDIVTPTVTHFELAKKAVSAGKHIFVEKPLVNTLDEAKKLMNLVAEGNIKAQVGHVERFNPAFLALKGKKMNPMFIETHRLAQFNPRGTDVSVILDLMIHDIDIILNLVKANVKKISASGVPIVSRSPDIANARIEFDNGCVANVTASRISMKNMRKTRIFQPDAYIGIDFLEKKTEIISLSTEKPSGDLNFMELNTKEGEVKYVQFEMPEVSEVNAIKMELELFLEAIENNTETPVTVADGFNAMKVAYQILYKITGERG
jgi:predicted dehydrogenase